MCDNSTALSTIQAGGIPGRPLRGIVDPVWRLLEKCWNTVPSERPSAAQIYYLFSELRSVPGKLTLQVLSLKTPPSEPKLWQQGFYVRLKYGDKVYTTPLATKPEGGGEYTWFVFRPLHPCYRH